MSTAAVAGWQATMALGPAFSLAPSHAAELRSLIRPLELPSPSPYHSLLSGRWVKLICGASFEDVAQVRNLSLVYTLAGVDCIDCAAEPSVVTAVREGVDAAAGVALGVDGQGALSLQKPWIMVSINDDEDVHFRKAEFDSTKCPPNCPRPCEHICPASAIKFSTTFGASQNHLLGGVLNDRCYGCGRCLSVCPLGLIGANSYIRNYTAVSDLLESGMIDAVEIHSNARHLEAFRKLWQSLQSSFESLKLIAVSLPDLGDDMLITMWDMYNVMKPELKAINIWQMDGRPMSGDIGAGATKAAIKLAHKIAAYTNRPPGFLQLAGGTNSQTVEALKAFGLFRDRPLNRKPLVKGSELNTLEEMKDERMDGATIAGIAYGGYARKIVNQVLECMDPNGSSWLENHPLLLLKALREANSLVGLSKGL